MYVNCSVCDNEHFTCKKGVATYILSSIYIYIFIFLFSKSISLTDIAFSDAKQLLVAERNLEKKIQSSTQKYHTPFKIAK